MKRTFPIGTKNTLSGHVGGLGGGDGAKDTRPASAGHSGKKKLEAKTEKKGQ